MSIPTKVLTDAHVVCGTLRGLSEGIKYWKPGEVTQDAIDRLHKQLSELQSKSSDVAGYISSQIKEEK